MSLDCLTPAGKRAIDQQHKALAAVCRVFSAEIAPTDDTLPAAIDAVLIKDGVVAGVAEVKCRSLSVTQLKNFGSLLISEEKLRDLRTVSRLLCAEGFVFAHLTTDGVVAWWRLCDDRGTSFFPYDTRTTVTQATVNGGTAHRLNAFLPVSRAAFFPVNDGSRAA